MKRFRECVVRDLVAGALVIAPIYLTILLLLKAMKSVRRVVRPLARLLPESFPAETVISLLLVLFVCLLVGITLRTSLGRAAHCKIESSLLQRIPGYDIIRGLTRQLAGQNQESSWRPALAEIEQALVPAFIVEELADGRFTVFVPSVPTPFAGTLYILDPERVHPVNVPFTHAIKVIARWGSGSKELVDKIEDRRTPSPKDEIAA